MISSLPSFASLSSAQCNKGHNTMNQPSSHLHINCWENLFQSKFISTDCCRKLHNTFIFCSSPPRVHSYPLKIPYPTNFTCYVRVKYKPDVDLDIQWSARRKSSAGIKGACDPVLVLLDLGVISHFRRVRTLILIDVHSSASTTHVRW